MKLEKRIESKFECGLADISRSNGLVNITGERRKYESGYSTKGIIL